ncbi:MAG: hypothetical protein VYD66_06490 [Candidatus Neomarinimicrobiota bacterium]|jgi:hypothetical protein|nr:hypothetical protein [Candidatus Neomarinimicrobiota bacterium]
MTRAEMNWKIVRSIIPIIVLATFVYYTQSLKPDYTSKEPVLTTDANDLVWRFQMNEGSELLNQIVKVNGNVTGIDSLLVILDHQVICAPDLSAGLVPSIGESITVKGRCIGYDDLLKELRLDHVVRITN